MKEVPPSGRGDCNTITLPDSDKNNMALAAMNPLYATLDVGQSTNIGVASGGTTTPIGVEGSADSTGKINMGYGLNNSNNA